MEEKYETNSGIVERRGRRGRLFDAVLFRFEYDYFIIIFFFFFVILIVVRTALSDIDFLFDNVVIFFVVVLDARPRDASGMRASSARFSCGKWCLRTLSLLHVDVVPMCVI